MNGLPEEWYSSRIGKKLFFYLTNFHMVELQTLWSTNSKFYRIRLSVKLDKPLRRLLRVGPSVRDEYHELFKCERLHC